MLHVIVDGANVVGSVPDGWWRDRAGAAERLGARLIAVLDTDPAGLAAAAGLSPEVEVVLVLEGAAARDANLPGHSRLRVVRAPADGDTTIVELTAALCAGGEVVVVTADRALRDRVRVYGARTIGPAALLAVISTAGPVTLHAEDDEPYFSTGERWDIES